MLNATTLAVCATSSATLFTVLLARRNGKSIQKRRLKRRKKPKFLRRALIPPNTFGNPTPWRQLLACGSVSDFVVAVNFPKKLIVSRLLPLFEEERKKFNFGSPYRKGPKVRGRPCTVSSVDILGLVLWFIKVSMPEYLLAPLFGIIPTSVNVWLDYGMEVLLRAVKRKSRREFEVRWPTASEMEASSALLQNNRRLGPLLRGVFGVVDGCRMPCADYTDPNLQNAFFEGFTQEFEVTNLFAFNFFGELIHAGVNFPGSWHDSKVAAASGLLFLKLSDSMTPPGNALLCDSAFAAGMRGARGKLIRSRKTNETEGIAASPEMAAVDIILQRVMPSERQSAEWGNRAVKAPFGRLKLPLNPDSLKRRRLLRIMAHLFNFSVVQSRERTKEEGERMVAQIANEGVEGSRGSARGDGPRQ